MARMSILSDKYTKKLSNRSALTTIISHLFANISRLFVVENEISYIFLIFLLYCVEKFYIFALYLHNRISFGNFLTL